MLPLYVVVLVTSLGVVMQSASPSGARQRDALRPDEPTTASTSRSGVEGRAGAAEQTAGRARALDTPQGK